MAPPIAWKMSPRDPVLELRSQLDNAPRDHAEALLEVYELLQGLHDRGVLDALRGGVGASDQILEKIIEAARTPESLRAMRNLLILSQLLASIEPEQLREIFQTPQSREEKPVGLWTLFKRICSKDSLRGLAAVVGILERFGRSLQIG